jgi:hypothetical protein
MRLLSHTTVLTITAIVLSSVGKKLSAQGLQACKLITAAEAAQALGKPAIAKAQVISPDKDTCGYLGSGFDVHTEFLKSPSGWSAGLQKQIKSGKAEVIPGIGDEAVYMKDGSGDNTATARKGNQMVSVWIHEEQGTAAQVKPLAIKLLKLAMAKVP